MSSKLKKAIGAVKDQTSISLAKVSSNSSSNLEVVVLKATSHDAVPIEDKYVHEILQLVSSNKIHAAACARAIGKRIGRTRNWVVALKSLMLVLRIFQDGDPYFPREVLHAMKRGAKILNLSSFRDDSNSSPWDFTSFIRTFALYLDERLECFLTGKLQRRYTHESSTSVYQRSKSRGALRPNNELVRDMKPAMLLDKMSHWQRLLDRAIATRPTGAAKTNNLVHISLYAIVQESFDLYKDISDGLALVLDSFFHLQYQNCVTAFQTCIKAVKQFEELSGYYTLCKSLGVGRSSEYPSVQAISEELIETLQEFLKDQSSFPSKPANRLLIGAGPGSPSSVRPRSVRHDSYGGQSDCSPTMSAVSDRTSEFGSQCTSLEDLISATETGISPAISIDLEAYSASQRRDDAFGVSDTGSSRSLPVTSSVADLMSLDDWTEENEKDEQDDEREEEKENGVSDTPASKDWETVLAETISSPLALSQPLSDNNTNTFGACPAQPVPAAEESPHTAVNGLDLVLFEAPPPQQPTPNTQMPTNNHYNPFLVDPFELPAVSNEQSAISAPTFQATPTFSVQNPNQTPYAVVQNENDPFASGGEFTGEKMFSSPMDHQNLQKEQQLWLQNQNKIIAKHWT
ncbi:clathrin coat assembly protein ap180 [Phtheirospermum japonicum]|uniref:Clathrin coat assembly protein ap180 n=1 Tax=Phtheirospermum japonicum TaxID=374723 RepID=A0A830B632_9LAMI|nr:clathrin coat assembly protein ap180 [Phtheirospermum japonicum]